MIQLPHNLISKERFDSNHTFCVEEWKSPARIETLSFLQGQGISSIWDIGANIGVFCATCLRRFSEAKITALEPDPENFIILRENFSLYPEIELKNVGVFYGVEQGQSMSVEGDPNIGGYMFSGLAQEHLGPYTGRVVTNQAIFRMQTLESLFTAPADLVKLDVEGSEYNIIENSEILKQCRFLLAEFHNHPAEYVQSFITQHLPFFEIVTLTNEHYGTDHHWYTFLIKRS